MQPHWKLLVVLPRARSTCKLNREESAIELSDSSRFEPGLGAKADSEADLA
jgi:hypothetical protein